MVMSCYILDDSYLGRTIFRWKLFDRCHVSVYLLVLELPFESWASRDSLGFDLLELGFTLSFVLDQFLKLGHI